MSLWVQDATWERGVVDKQGVPDQAVPADEVAASGAGTRPGRLYFTDGTNPNYQETGTPHWLPGQKVAGSSGISILCWLLTLYGILTGGACAPCFGHADGYACKMRVSGTYCH